MPTPVTPAGRIDQRLAIEFAATLALAGPLTLAARAVGGVSLAAAAWIGVGAAMAIAPVLRGAGTRWVARRRARAGRAGSVPPDA